MRLPLYGLLPALFAIASCGAVIGPSYRDDSVTIASSASFDASRYVGRWYEVARYPNPFQADCPGAIADYALTETPGVLSVTNTCLDAAGRAVDTISGTATDEGLGRLSVRLEGVPVAAPYWVLWVDEGYRTAVVGAPNGRVGWILNREPEIPSDRLAAAREVLDFNGYDLAPLTRSVTP
ncbi:lipocalin family protein [Gymnodinialimonas ceratoperidinii]|uniref:Outer membrane lipoprotein Blc n=1 Tax=Gymnodinialimonas ceratoperidinii TaxID=2856823 RepID=A0A8F6YDP8_9RHOB|nr:lipocalin family protein [Gymnodinialimonas ceratoperidinii]QXT40417.1 lipocalin family protein [Gymnodinialimonas ceratoperidinii]